ncbi:GerMN domain-containing protein [Mumia sp. zg.B53]|uniref:GerMN domain-containing protein n=1 Tax=unclassified Mumia TaxID=2621872 RepID=UPI001C6EDABC|nr:MULTISPECIES: GerMN domain-containing protein [unclassified Mumia]MBW9205909.1 GerMN domain-containing protein [Mumia sp. zg.B17]MBW9208086.1 GerMN domain-containing protein [Mumia sp. zg.B21]MBW9216040.1 GerMN domain-containing protein [Mumia sp. zg.B53]
MSRAARLGAAAVLALSLGACAIGAEPAPRDAAVTAPRLPAYGPTVGRERAMDVEVCLLERGRLRRVGRTAAAGGVASALRSLARGPTGGERRAGLTTDVPQSAEESQVTVASSVAQVEVPTGFARLTAEQQIRAMAQIVCSVTSGGVIRSVRLVSDGKAVFAPVGSGALVDRSVGLGDYPAFTPR